MKSILAVGEDPHSFEAVLTTAWLIAERFESYVEGVAVHALTASVTSFAGFRADDYQILRHLGNYACGTGEYEKGLEWLERATSVAHDEERLISDLGHCRALAGQREGAEAALAKLEQVNQKLYVDPVLFALVYVGLGETERALEVLERAYENQAAHLTDVPMDPRFRPLHSEPRYEEIVKGIGLAHVLPPPKG